MKVYRRLDRAKYQMDFCINQREKCTYTDEILSMGGRMFYVPPKSYNFRQYKSKLSSLIQNEGYNTVLRITSNAAGFLDLKIAKAAGAKRCIARSSNSSDGSSKIIKLIHYVSRAFLMQYVDIKIAPSDLAARYSFGQIEVDKGNVSILNNAVDLDVYCYSKTGRDEIRADYQLGGRLIIGHIGRFAVQKNHAFLLDVFAEIMNQRKDAVLLLVGTGELEPAIREKAERIGLIDSIIFTGVRSDIPQLLSAMDVFLFPSLYEGMPNTVIEAQATGLPCIVSNAITREADITGLVKYLSLNDSSKLWADAALASVSDARADTKQDFLNKHYDIECTVNEFVRLVFGKND